TPGSPVGDPSFSGVRRRTTDAPGPQPVEVRGDRQRAADGTHRPIEGELAEPGCIAGERPVQGSIDDRRRDREIEPGTLLWELRRSQVHGHPPAGEFEAAVVDRDLDTFPGLL